MLTLPQTAEYALRAVCYIAEHQGAGPVSGRRASALGAPKTISRSCSTSLGYGVFSSPFGAPGVGTDWGWQRISWYWPPSLSRFMPETERRCIMGRTRCREDRPCGAHYRWKEVRDTAAAFFTDLTIADLLRGEAW